MTAVSFIALAALGTVARAVFTTGQPTGAIPRRTLAVNIMGSLVLGLVEGAQWWHDPIALTVAGLGSFTTFSTVIAETVALVDDGQQRSALAYLGLTLAIGVAAACLGLEIGYRL